MPAKIKKRPNFRQQQLMEAENDAAEDAHKDLNNLIAETTEELNKEKEIEWISNGMSQEQAEFINQPLEVDLNLKENTPALPVKKDAEADNNVNKQNDNDSKNNNTEDKAPVKKDEQTESKKTEDNVALVVQNEEEDDKDAITPIVKDPKN